MLNRLFTNVNLFEKGLDASWKKNEAIANNIANVDTPGFKRTEVEFESVFANELNAGKNSFFHATNELSKNFKDTVIRSNTIHTNDELNTPDSDSGKFNPQFIKDSKQSIRMDENSVDIDYEMTELAKNAIFYEGLTHSISKEIGRIKYIIKEGR